MLLCPHKRAGFTLIELSIVLVVIGLVIGGIMVGRDLVEAAGIRSQLTQVEKFRIATNTFRTKYGYLPGDIPEPTASGFGFQARGQYKGEGDGNGVLEGVYDNLPNIGDGRTEGAGETPVFWIDLSAAGLIEGSYYGASTTTCGFCGNSVISGAELAHWFPLAKIGNGNSLYVWSGGYGIDNHINYFGLSKVLAIQSGWGVVNSQYGLSVRQAYLMDAKVDDGLPNKGRVTAEFLSGGSGWSWGPNGVGISPELVMPFIAADNSCFDNNNQWTNDDHYSMQVNNGDGVNCNISFKFQ